MKAKEILFRPSEISKIMTNPKTKTTNLQKYESLQKKIAKQEAEMQELDDDPKMLVAAQYGLDLLRKQLAELEPLKDLPNLSQGCQTYLKEKFVEVKYGRRKDADNKYMRKGRECEEAGITLYSLIKGRLFENNKQRVSNGYLTGEIDLGIKNDKGEIIEISDIKNAYDAHTFIANLDNVKTENRYQLLAYMDLYPTAERGYIANVLVNNSADAILNALHYESYKWPEADTPAWREIEIIKNHIYDQKTFEEFVALRGCIPMDDKSQAMYDSFVEIPQEERLIEHVVERDNAEINAMRVRIDECREWMRIMFNLD